jgi:hypothetical protein
MVGTGQKIRANDQCSRKQGVLQIILSSILQKEGIDVADAKIFQIEWQR